MKKSFVPRSILKQKARQLKKEKSLSQHHALDESARSFGFANFRNFLNLSEENWKNQKKSKLALIQALDQERQSKVTAAVDRSIAAMRLQKESLEGLIESLEDARRKRKSIQPICRKRTDLKEYIELYLLRDFLMDEDAGLETDAPDHVAKEVTINDLDFKFRKGELFVAGEYNLKLDFAYEYGPNESHSLFEDIDMSGFFEVKVDKSLKVTLEDQDIGLS